LTQTDAKGQVFTLSYDTLGRLTERDNNGASYADFVYDGAANGVGLLQKSCVSASSNTSCTAATTTRTFTYDSLSRPATTTIAIDGTNHVYTTAYDANLGKVATVAYPSGFTAQYLYNSIGYLCRVTDNGGAHTCTTASDSHVLWTLNSADAAMHVTSETAGNAAFTTSRTFDAYTGRLATVRAGPSDNIAQFDYGYDYVGNLTYRDDGYNNVYEKFCYDALNRLLYSATGSTTPAACTSTGTGITAKSVTYDALGDIATKSDVGTYGYPAAGSARPHAVASIAGTVAGVTNPDYGYDVNGNLTCIYASSGGSCASPATAIAYTETNMTRSIVQGTVALCFSYDSGDGRIKMESRSSSCSGTLSSTTDYLADPASGAMSEKVVTSSTTTWHDYITAGGALIGERSCTGASPCTSGATMQYFVRDHLGSIARITDATGTLTESDSYDAWGRRRNINGTDSSACSLTSATTAGYTGHEMLDSVCEINANARIYDPTLGRFLSADTMVQDAQNGQAFNRYSYVLNGPLSATDPSGNIVQRPDAPILPIDDSSGFDSYTEMPECRPIAGPLSRDASDLVGDLDVVFIVSKSLRRTSLNEESGR
jgi:RHS repeat-associated protein